MKALVLALVSVVVSSVVASSAFAKGDALDFEGAYRLQKSVTGMCETFLAVYRQDDDENFRNMFVGSYIMRNVDGGEYVWEDSFVKRRINANVRGNVLEQKEVIWDKSLKRTETRRFGIRKNGKRLDLWSYNSFTPALPLKCVYKWVSDTPFDLPN